MGFLSQILYNGYCNFKVYITTTLRYILMWSVQVKKLDFFMFITLNFANNFFMIKLTRGRLKRMSTRGFIISLFNGCVCHLHSAKLPHIFRKLLGALSSVSTGAVISHDVPFFSCSARAPERTVSRWSN